MTQSGKFRAGVGGWTFEPWRETFYPKEVRQKDELAWMASKLTAIEINATYYRGQKPESFAKWAAAAPDGFKFTLKGNRFVTNRRELAGAGESLEKFFAQGLEELGEKLGPIFWQFAPTKKFEPDDFEAFLKLLPREHAGLELRHAVEVRHESFCTPGFPALLREYGVACVYAKHAQYPEIADLTADFVYARLQTGSDDIPTCYSEGDLDQWAARAKVWMEGGEPRDLPRVNPDHLATTQPRDVFCFLIHEGKSRAPAGAMALIERMK